MFDRRHSSHSEYAFARHNDHFDDPEQDTQFVDTDLLLRIQSKRENNGGSFELHISEF